jgi:hypothetical protein
MSRRPTRTISASSRPRSGIYEAARTLSAATLRALLRPDSVVFRSIRRGSLLKPRAGFLSPGIRIVHARSGPKPDPTSWVFFPLPYNSAQCHSLPAVKKVPIRGGRVTLFHTGSVDITSWTPHRNRRKLLGASGKRIGTLRAGLDGVASGLARTLFETERAPLRGRGVNRCLPEFTPKSGHTWRGRFKKDKHPLTGAKRAHFFKTDGGSSA